MEAQGVRFTADVCADPIYVLGDPSRLEQIHANLLNNAAKYTPRGGDVTLEVRLDGDDALIRVRDTGAGIPPDMLESVFDLFVQSSRTLDRAGGGLGLGLTLVRSLVTMHGGTVKASSEGEGRGSEFLVRLPLAHGPVAAASAGPKDVATPAAPRSLRVVVVEDNADSRETLCVFLERAGFDCQVAGTGPQALALMEATSPHVVILDIGLPGMDGFEIARRIRANDKHAGVRLIALTGYGQAADRRAADAAGFDAHLVKPVDPDRLLDLLVEERPSG
jgi:two-component system CheB/CheR fusion protein